MNRFAGFYIQNIRSLEQAKGAAQGAPPLSLLKRGLSDKGILPRRKGQPCKDGLLHGNKAGADGESAFTGSSAVHRRGVGQRAKDHIIYLHGTAHPVKTWRGAACAAPLRLMHDDRNLCLSPFRCESGGASRGENF